MIQVLFATGNSSKFDIAKNICEKLHIELVQAVVDIDEIQGEDPEKIISRKAHDTYKALQKPAIVSDDSWSIPGLRGFPGPYMKSVNHWFTAEDFIHLTKDLADRRVILQRYLTYYDGKEIKMFHQDITGQLLTEQRGDSYEESRKIIALDIDHGLSVAEVYNAGTEHAPQRLSELEESWRDFAAWYTQTGAVTSN
jgi:XTP/dITP diphosphohydrolase